MQSNHSRRTRGTATTRPCGSPQSATITLDGVPDGRQMVQYRKPRRFQDSARGFQAKPLRILVLLGIAFIGGTVLSDTVGRVFRTHALPTGLFSAFAQDSER